MIAAALFLESNANWPIEVYLASRAICKNWSFVAFNREVYRKAGKGGHMQKVKL
jgi:hypothetical protein